jgi:hypothetical protein
MGGKRPPIGNHPASGPFTGELQVTYVTTPRGELGLFYAGYRYSRGMIRLDRLDAAIEPLLTRGKFPLRIECLS